MTKQQVAIVWRIGCGNQSGGTVPLWEVMHLRCRTQLYRTGRAATDAPYLTGLIRPRRDQDFRMTVARPGQYRGLELRAKYLHWLGQSWLL